MNVRCPKGCKRRYCVHSDRLIDKATSRKHSRGIPSETRFWTEESDEPTEHRTNNLPAYSQTGTECAKPDHDFQCPPEVFEQEPRSSDNAERTVEDQDRDPILNQQWKEPLHLQTPMIPTNTPISQRDSQNRSQTQLQIGTTNTSNPNSTAREDISTSTMCRQVEASLDEWQERQLNERMSDQPPTTQVNMSTSVTNQQINQTNSKQCTCHNQPSNGYANQGTQPTGGRRLNLHTEYEDTDRDGSKFCHSEKDSGRNGSRECKIIRILPDENVDFMDLVRDSVSALAQTGPKPMFVNNYFVGDNNWRTVAKEKPDSTRHTDELRNRSSTAVQTAVSFLGEEDKPCSFMQADILRVKAMGSNGGEYNTQSPLIMEPMKNGNSTGWLTHSFNLPEVQQNTPARQQCKGLPDLTMPQPPIQTQTRTQGHGSANTSESAKGTILRVIEKMTDTMEQHMRLSVMRSD